MKKRKRKLSKGLKKDLNLILGSIVFILLIGSAFAIDWIFGIIFVVGFILSILNKTLEKKPFIPILIFIGGLVIRISLFLFIPRIFEAKTWVDLGIAVVVFLIVLIVGFRIRIGKV